MTVQIVDNADAGFVTGAGSWGVSTGEGRGGSLAYAFTASPTPVGTWTVPCTAGVVRRVSATWVPSSNRGTGITFKVYDGAAAGTPFKTRVVNQFLAPTDLLATDGADWHDLAVLTPTGTFYTVVIEATAAAGDGGLGVRAGIADALRDSTSDFPFFPRIRAGTLLLDPDRNTLRLLAETNPAGADLGVSSVCGDGVTTGTATLSGASVSRGPWSITLSRPLFYSDLTFVQWYLNVGHGDVVDDSAAAHTGTWVTQTWPGPLFAFGGTRTYSDDPTATRTYTFTGVVPGAYRLRTSVLDGDPTYATAATYKVYDGAVSPGNLVATLVLDQSVARDVVNDFDDVEQLYRLRSLGDATVAGATVNVVVSGAGTGTLIADALKITRLQQGAHSAVPADATALVFDATDEWATTTAGAIPAVVAAAVTLADDDAWFETRPGEARTLKLGYNKGHQNNNDMSLWSANLMRGAIADVDEQNWSLGTHGLWTLRSGSGTWACDQDGNLTAMTGTPVVGMHLVGITFNGTDVLSLTSAPSSGTWRFKYATPDAGHIPTFVRPFDSENNGIRFGALVGPMLDPYGSGMQVCTRTYAPTLTESTLGGGVRACYQMGVETDGVASGIIATIDEVTPPTWAHDTHPVLYDRLHGRNFEAIRDVDLAFVVGDRNAQVADIANSTRVSQRIPSTTARCNLVAVHPIDPADPVVLRNFDPGTKLAVVEIEVDSTAGFSDGQYVFSDHLSDDHWDDTAGGGHPAGATGPGLIKLSGFIHVVVKSATRFVAYVESSTNWPDAMEPDIITLAASHTLTGTLAEPKGIGVGLADYVAFCNEVGVGPWFCIPHGATDAYVAFVAAYCAANLDPALRSRVEYSNETWNRQSIGFAVANIFMITLWKRYEYDWQLDNTRVRPLSPTEAFAQRSGEVHAAFLAAYVGAGGNSARVRRVMGSWAGSPGQGTVPIVNYLTRAGTAGGTWIAFDELAIDHYLQNYPLNRPYPLTYAGTVYEDADPSGLASLLAAHQAHGGHKQQAAEHVAQLARLPYAADLVSYEGAYEDLCPYGVRRLERSLAVARHPRMFKARTGRLRAMQGYGFTLAVGFNMDESARLADGINWPTFTSATGGTGTGDPAENANPFAVNRLSQIGGADRAWALAAATGGGLSQFAGPLASPLFHCALAR